MRHTNFKIPTKLKVGGHTYKIIFADLEDLGKTDRVKNIIYIDKSLPENQKIVTLFHEILHTFNNEMPHTLVDSLAEQTYALIKDNKWTI